MLVNCILRCSHRTFSLEATKVGFVISLLQGEPQAWAHRLLEKKAASLTDLTTFFNAMAQLYEVPQQTATAEAALHSLQQCCQTAENYVSECRCWSSDTNWNDVALHYQFRMGLSEPPKDELAWFGVPLSLDALINLSIQIDRRLRERKSERTTGQSRPLWMLLRVASSFNTAPKVPTASVLHAPEPMQLGLLRTLLTIEERKC